jgi:phage terminase Nu1 subunit (DNA packaging protein)
MAHQPKTKKFIPLKAWAIVSKKGHLVTMDWRLPIAWYRRMAKEEAAERGANIVRVEITEA